MGRMKRYPSIFCSAADALELFCVAYGNSDAVEPVGLRASSDAQKQSDAVTI